MADDDGPLFECNLRDMCADEGQDYAAVSNAEERQRDLLLSGKRPLIVPTHPCLGTPQPVLECACFFKLAYGPEASSASVLPQSSPHRRLSWILNRGTEPRAGE